MVDVVNETVEDIAPGMRKVFEEKDHGKKKKRIQEFATEGCQPHLNKLEKLLKQNNGGKGWFVGDKITIADIVVFGVLHDNIPQLIGTTVGNLQYLKNQDLLRALIERFKAEPKVSEWLQKIPKTPF